MAATIKTKIRTTTGGTASTTAGELCVNTSDKKIFIGDGSASVDLFGNLATTAGKLSQFAATTSAELAGVISNETGSGSLVFGTSPSISTLEISTTGTANKTAAINMASGVTATDSVVSQITLNAYNADSLGAPPVPFTKTAYISCTDGYDLQLGTGYDSYIAFEGNVISLGDVAGANSGGVITIDSPDAGYIGLSATNILIATTTPEVGKVLTCMDGSGTVSWETPSGGSGSGTPDYVLFNLGII